MNHLLEDILEAHGGMSCWSRYRKVEATIVSGGGLFALKGTPQDSAPRRMTVWLDEERSSVSPYGSADQRTMFTPERIAIEKVDGTVVTERNGPRDSFAGHQMNTPWDALHRAYFNGEALWTYLTTPFLLAREDVRVEETNLGVRTQKSGADCVRISPPRLKPIASFKISSSGRIVMLAATTTT